MEALGVIQPRGGKVRLGLCVRMGEESLAGALPLSPCQGCDSLLCIIAEDGKDYLGPMAWSDATEYFRIAGYVDASDTSACVRAGISAQALSTARDFLNEQLQGYGRSCRAYL